VSGRATSTSVSVKFYLTNPSETGYGVKNLGSPGTVKILPGSPGNVYPFRGGGFPPGVKPDPPGEPPPVSPKRGEKVTLFSPGFPPVSGSVSPPNRESLVNPVLTGVGGWGGFKGLVPVSGVRFKPLKNGGFNPGGSPLTPLLNPGKRLGKKPVYGGGKGGTPPFPVRGGGRGFSGPPGARLTRKNLGSGPRERFKKGGGVPGFPPPFYPPGVPPPGKPGTPPGFSPPPKTPPPPPVFPRGKGGKTPRFTGGPPPEKNPGGGTPGNPP